MKRRINILGVGFDNLTIDEAVNAAVELTEQGGYCVTPNPEIVFIARKDAEFADAVNNASLVVADGIGVIYAAKILGTPLKAKVTGIDLAERVIQRLAEDNNNRGVFLFGAKPGIAEIAAANLTAKYPNLKIAGIQNGYDYEERAVIDRIAELNPAFAFVCLGMKKQELFMAKAFSEFKPRNVTCLMAGLGGALDTFAGTVARAPESWRRLNLEWLYRLIKQPGRIGRMIKLPLILILALKERIFGRADNI